MRSYLIEVVGTFALVLTAVVALGRAEPLAAIAVGAVLAAMLTLGPDTHLNPAVSLGAVLRRELPAAELMPYWAAQLLGALGGAALAMWVAQIPAAPALSGEQLLKAGVIELVLTFVLVLVALSAPAATRALAVGLVMTAALLVAVPVSGGSINPALAFGQAVSGLGTWGSIWVLLVATLAGGALAGVTALVVEGDAGDDEGHPQRLARRGDLGQHEDADDGGGRR